MKDAAKQVAEFKRWYDDQWLGDREHGQTVPLHTGEPKYTEYLDGYTLALGAWITATRAEREACAAAAEALERTGREWVRDSLWANIKRDTAAAIRDR